MTYQPGLPTAGNPGRKIPDLTCVPARGVPGQRPEERR
jgi:hypothetical protein